MSYLLGIDNGGTVIKAAVFDTAGNEVAVSSRETPLLTPRPGFYERDMEELWQTNAACIREALRLAEISPGAVAGVGCTGHGKGLYLWGRDNSPAYYGIASTDRRAAAYVEKWKRDKTALTASRITLQTLLACQPVALLAWLKENRPEVYGNIRWVLACKDYIRLRLTGEACAERTDFSGSGLLDLRSGGYSLELLRLFGIEEMMDCLPPLCASDEKCGVVTAQAAQETGLLPGTPVCGGMFDIDACAVAMDVTTPDRLCAVTGTWSINEYPSVVPVSSDGSSRTSLFCLPELYLIEESSPTSAGNLEWYIRHFMKAEKNINKRGRYAKADELVQGLPPEDSPVVFLPYLYGAHNGEAGAVFAGLLSEHGPAHLLRAIYEGVVFSHRYHIDRLLEKRPAPTAVRLAGGAARSPVWVQMFADVLQLPVEVVSARELGALGAAMAAAVCTGVFTDWGQAAHAMVHVERTVRPDPSAAEIYRKKYTRYRKLMSRMEDIEDA